MMAALATLLLAAAAAAPSTPARHGPAELRDTYLLAQPRLTLPAMSPDTVPAGTWRLRVAGSWSSTFGWEPDRTTPAGDDAAFVVDGEHRTLELEARRGLLPGLDVSARLPLHWRGRGVLDAVIDAWHGWFGLADNGRGRFSARQFRVEGQTRSGGLFSWGETGAGLGNVEVGARWRVQDDPEGWSTALAARLELPTATAPFDGSGPGVGAQLLGARRLARGLDLFLGAGLTAQRARLRGVSYAPRRVHGFAALEWRAMRRLSLTGQTDVAGRLVDGVAGYPGLHWLVHATGRIELSPHAVLELGFTENLADLDATTDFGVYAGVIVRP